MGSGNLSEAVDHKLREVFSSVTVGEGDIAAVIIEAQVFEVGAAVMHNDLEHTVDADRGDAVELIVPATRFPLRGGGGLHVPGGNATTVAKSDLTLETLL